MALLETAAGNRLYCELNQVAPFAAFMALLETHGIPAAEAEEVAFRNFKELPALLEVPVEYHREMVSYLLNSPKKVQQQIKLPQFSLMSFLHSLFPSWRRQEEAS